MARWHRAPVAGAPARAARGVAAALSRSDRRAQRARPIEDLSWIAGAGARLAASAGPADRLRSGAGGAGGAVPKLAARPSHQDVGRGWLDRSVGLCAPEGAPGAGPDRPSG